MTRSRRRTAVGGDDRRRDDLCGEGLSLRYVRLRDAALWDRNPKRHDMGGIIASIRTHGFRDAPIFDGELRAIVAGNGRTTALRLMREAEEPPPRGVMVDPDGEWWLPMQFGVDAASREQAEGFGVDHNGLTVSGGDLGFAETLGLFEGDRLVMVLADAHRAEVQVSTFDADDLHAILHPPPPAPRPIGKDAADGVATITCPNCGKEIPR